MKSVLHILPRQGIERGRVVCSQATHSAAATLSQRHHNDHHRTATMILSHIFHIHRPTITITTVTITADLSPSCNRQYNAHHTYHHTITTPHNTTYQYHHYHSISSTTLLPYYILSPHLPPSLLRHLFHYD